MKRIDFKYELVAVFLIGICFWVLLISWICKPVQHSSGIIIGPTYTFDPNGSITWDTEADSLEIIMDPNVSFSIDISSDELVWEIGEPNLTWEHATITVDPYLFFASWNQGPQIEYVFDANSNPEMMGRFFSYYMKSENPYGGNISFYIPEKDAAEYDKIYNEAQND